MANPKKSESLFADGLGKPMGGLQASKVNDVAAIAIAYATDDPGVTVDGTINIADGDGTLVTAEVLTAIEELVAKVNAVITNQNAIIDVLETHGLSSDT